MSALHENPHTIRFACEHCHAALTVPVDLANVKGPCPHCGTTIEAPSAGVGQSFPFQDLGREQARSTSAAAPEGRTALPPPRGDAPPQFVPSRVIAETGQPKDDSWKAKSRSDGRRRRRSRKADEKVTSLFESDWFFVVRGALAVLAIGIMVVTVLYMHKNEWGAVNDRAAADDEKAMLGSPPETSSSPDVSRELAEPVSSLSSDRQEEPQMLPDSVGID